MCVSIILVLGVIFKRYANGRTVYISHPQTEIQKEFYISVKANTF